MPSADFRAVAHTDGRIEQSFQPNKHAARQWLKSIIDGRPGAMGYVFEMCEHLVDTLEGPPIVLEAMTDDALCANCPHPAYVHKRTCKTSDLIYGSCAHIDCRCNNFRSRMVMPHPIVES